MKNIILKSMLLLTVSAAGMAGCGRDDDKAGKGGKGVIKVTPQHHQKNITDCTVYIKYDTKNQPSSYDDSAKCILIDGVPTATFTELKKGNYYFYGAGFDPNIGQNVVGGIAHELTEEKSEQIYLPVTEGD